MSFVPPFEYVSFRKGPVRRGVVPLVEQRAWIGFELQLDRSLRDTEACNAVAQLSETHGQPDENQLADCRPAVARYVVQVYRHHGAKHAQSEGRNDLFPFHTTSTCLEPHPIDDGQQLRQFDEHRRRMVGQ